LVFFKCGALRPPRSATIVNLFWLYFTILFISMIGTVESRQTIHSLLWLIAAFISGALFFFTVGADIIGLLLIIVYVGAVGMFFLFMIMLLDPQANPSSNQTFWEVVLLTTISLFYIPDRVNWVWDALVNQDHWIEDVFVSADLGSIAAVLYEWYGWPLIVLSLLLFKAMLVAINIARSHHQ